MPTEPIQGFSVEIEVHELYDDEHYPLLALGHAIDYAKHSY